MMPLPESKNSLCQCFEEGDITKRVGSYISGHTQTSCSTFWCISKPGGTLCYSRSCCCKIVITVCILHNIFIVTKICLEQ